MKKKTELDLAIEHLEADLKYVSLAHSSERGELDAKYAGRIQGLEQSINTLRAQQAAKPKRQRRAKTSPATNAPTEPRMASGPRP